MEAEGRKSNKIREIVRLHQLLKKWRKQAKASKTTNNGRNTTTTTTTTINNNNNNGSNKGINKFLKKTLSFSENSVHSAISSVISNSDYVPKGYLAVSVGKEEEGKRRYVIPTQFLGHQAFGILLREAEKDFGFEQQGVLQIPCDVAMFENIVRLLENNNGQSKRVDHDQEEMLYFQNNGSVTECNSSPDCHYNSFIQSSYPQLCR